MVKKLSPQELKAFRDLLLHAEAVVSGDLSHLEAEALGRDGMSGSTDAAPGNVGESYFLELNLELLERDQSTQREILEALTRIDEGRYGACEECETQIPRVRLKAMPHARLCIDCQRGVERGGKGRLASGS